jgi:Fic family protein
MGLRGRSVVRNRQFNRRKCAANGSLGRSNLPFYIVLCIILTGIATGNFSGRNGMSASAIEPVFPAVDGQFESAAIALHREAAALAATAHPRTRGALARVLLAVNSYYSNLIEGNRTTPAEIAAALKKDFSSDPARAALQRLAVAHIRIEHEVATELAADANLEVTSAAFLLRAHRGLYDGVPDSERVVKGSDGSIAIVTPGEFRTRGVSVGRHVPPPAADLPAFLARFHDAYRPAPLSPVRRVIAFAASHHRLAWIHPFLDGNGRVTRLMSTAYARRIDLDGGGLWSISRGFARHHPEYFASLAAADAERRNDYDGRGPLSMAALEEWCEFVVRIALDQISYMRSLIEPSSLTDRLRAYSAYRAAGGVSVSPSSSPNAFSPWRAESGELLARLVSLGELPRADALAALPGGERTRREALRTLLLEGVLESDHHRAPVRLAFPDHMTRVVFPDLFALPVNDSSPAT